LGNVGYQNYKFFDYQNVSQFKLTKLQHSTPRNMALVQNAEILENINDFILITEAEPIDEVGPRIIYVKKAFEKISGFTLSDVFGENPRIFQGENTSDESRKKIKQALLKWEPITIEILNYT
jgi:PAS domain-containing protein